MKENLKVFPFFSVSLTFTNLNGKGSLSSGGRGYSYKCLRTTTLGFLIIFGEERLCSKSSYGSVRLDRLFVTNFVIILIVNNL